MSFLVGERDKGGEETLRCSRERARERDRVLLRPCLEGSWLSAWHGMSWLGLDWPGLVWAGISKRRRL